MVIKIKKQTVRVLIFLLLLASLVLTSCNGDEIGKNETTSSADVETSAVPESSLDIAKDGAILITRVVRPSASASDSVEVSAAKQIRDNLFEVGKHAGVADAENKSGVELSEDFLMPGASLDDSIEILVGKTDYDESRQVFAELAYGDYAVKAVGNKIVVASYTQTGYDAAVSKLHDMMIGGCDAESGSIIFRASDIDIHGTAKKMLDNIPLYDGGEFYSFYQASNYVDEVIIKNTNIDEFDEYLSKLSDNGYTQYSQKTVGKNKFTTYTNADYTLNVGFYKYENSARILIEELAPDVPAEVTSYDKVTASQVTMLGLEYLKSGEYQSVGLSLLIRLEDGSFIVIDGGFNDNSSADNLLLQLREQSKDYAKSMQDIRIAAWIITHVHGDHMGMIGSKYEKFKSVQIDYFLINFMSDSERERSSSLFVGKENSKWTSSGVGSLYTNVLTAAESLDVEVRTAHVGQDYCFANTKFEILYTIECFGPRAYSSLNTTSMIIKATIGDTVIMITGDATGDAMEIAAKMYGDYLKSDIVQVSHHGCNTSYNDAGTKSAYAYMKPTTLLWPHGGHDFAVYPEKAYNK